MPRINCYLPIKLCITGRLADSQLEQLSDTLVRAISARMSFAERTLASANGGNLWAGDIEIVREGYDPQRDDTAADVYQVPSYQSGGRPTTIPVRGRSSLSRRPWFIRKAINFHAYVGEYLDYIESIRPSRTLSEKVIYTDLFNEIRWVSAWLVQVNRSFLVSDLQPILYQRAAELSRIPENQLLAHGEAFYERNRRDLIEIDLDSVVTHEIPDMSNNYRRLVAAGHDVRLQPGAWILMTTMPLPKIELADVLSLDAEIRMQIRLRDLAFLVNATAFESRFGLSWETYIREMGDQPVTLRLQPFTVRRRTHGQAILYFIQTFADERIRSELTSRDTTPVSDLYLLNSTGLAALPAVIRRHAEPLTNDATRAADDSEDHWEANWRGLHFLAVVTITQDDLGAALYRPQARRHLPSLLSAMSGDPEDYGWGRNLYNVLANLFGSNPPETRPPGGNVFEYVLAELETRGEFDTLFDKVERANHNVLHQLLIRLTLATRYATHTRVLRSHQVLMDRILSRRRNIYFPERGEIWLDRNSAKTVRVGGVFGETDSIYIFERDDKRLKPARVPAFREALQIEREALIGRILTGQDTTQYTEEDFVRVTIGAAAQRMNLSEDDFEEITIQRSMRLLRVEARMVAALPRRFVTFEFVERVEGEAWQSASGPITEIEDDFEARLIYWALGRAGEVYEAAGIVISVVGLVAIAWQAGIIAILIEAAGGATAVLFSIGVSELIYILRVIFGDARLTLRGFLEAALDGYLMALGFRGAGFLGRAAARMIGKETLTRLIGGWLTERLIVGTVGGAGTAALTTFTHDLINVATGTGGWSGIDRYVHNMAWGALLGTVFEFGVGALQPLLRAGGESALGTLSEFVTRVREQGFTAARWTALTAEALGNLRTRLSLVIGDVAAQGFTRAMAARLTQVTEQLGQQYRLAVFRRVLELSPGTLTRNSVGGLEKFLSASRTDLTNEAALALLNRLNPTQLRAFLEAVNILENPLISALSRTGHLETLAGAPQLAGVIRNDPVLSQFILTSSALPANAATARVQGLLSVAQGLPAVPETVARGQFFARGGTSQVFEVEGQSGLLVKQGGGRLPVEAQGLVELELMGIDTVYAATRRIEGQTNIVLRRVDGVSSKDIIGRLSSPLRTPQHVEIVTQRTIDDLERIYSTLQRNRTNIGDFQFIVRRSDGAVFVNDPVSVTPSSGPSGNIRNIIDRFRRILRTNQSPPTGE